MPVIRKIYLHRLYGMKNIIPFRLSTLFACLLTGAFIGAVVYIKQNGLHQQEKMLHHRDIENIKAEHEIQIMHLESHIASLNSRIKHLAVDNKRLSSKSYDLLQKINQVTVAKAEEE